jgi:hypothetical protein
MQSLTGIKTETKIPVYTLVAQQKVRNFSNHIRIRDVAQIADGAGTRDRCIGQSDGQYFSYTPCLLEKIASYCASRNIHPALRKLVMNYIQFIL